MSTLDKALAGIKANIESKNKNTNVEHDGKRDIKDNSVTKSNALARSYYRFSLVEKRCMESLISKLHPLRTDNNTQSLILSAIEYAAAFKVPEKIAYRDINKGTKGLVRKVITAVFTDKEEEYPLMAKATYKKNEGIVECKFNNEILPHLIGLQKKFTSYPLGDAASFNSSYTWRFYELLMSWAQPKNSTGGLLAGWTTIEVEELRKILGVPPSYNFTTFNKRVVDVVKTELREHANIHVSIEQQKTVRTISHLKIEFIEDRQQKLKGM